MKDWQLRILAERCELYTKVIKLRVWLRGTNYGQELEIKQFQIMEKYLAVLDERIERFMK